MHAGLGAKKLCCNQGICDAAFYQWWSKFSGLDVANVRKPKALEDRIAKLNKPLAKQMMDVSIQCVNVVVRNWL